MCFGFFHNDNQNFAMQNTIQELNLSRGKAEICDKEEKNAIYKPGSVDQPELTSPSFNYCDLPSGAGRAALRHISQRNLYSRYTWSYSP